MGILDLDVRFSFRIFRFQISVSLALCCFSLFIFLPFRPVSLAYCCCFLFFLFFLFVSSFILSFLSFSLLPFWVSLCLVSYLTDSYCFLLLVTFSLFFCCRILLLLLLMLLISGITVTLSIVIFIDRQIY